MDTATVIQIGLLIFGVVSSTLYSKFQLVQVVKEMEELKNLTQARDEKKQSQIEAGFKKIDKIMLYNSSSNFLDSEEARREYVARKELDLRMELLNQKINYLIKGMEEQ